MTKTTLFASIALSLSLGACQKPADLDKMKRAWDAQAVVFANEAKQLARWQLSLEKKRTELTTRGPSRIVDQAQGPLTAAGDGLREVLTGLEKQLGPEAEAKRKSGKVAELVKFTETNAERLTEELHNVRATLQAADDLLAAAEHAPVRIAATPPPQGEPVINTAPPGTPTAPAP